MKIQKEKKNAFSVPVPIPILNLHGLVLCSFSQLSQAREAEKKAPMILFTNPS